MIHKRQHPGTVKIAAYFLKSGIFWGSALGMLAGTVVFPFFGSIVGAIWGALIGVITGMIAAFTTVLVYPAQPLPEKTTSDRRRLTLILGGVTLFSMPALMMLTTNGILWGEYYPFSMVRVLFVLIAISCPLASLSIANSASRFVDVQADENDDPLAEFGDPKTSLEYFLRQPTHKWVVIFLGVWVAVDALVSHYEIQSIIQFGLMVLVSATLSIVLLSSLIGVLLGFLNRIYFVEYASHWTLARYRMVMMGLVGGLVGIMLLFWVYTWFAFSPVPFVSGFYAAYRARGYAERYYEMQGKPKRKGKPKNEGELELGQEIT
jgi:hypothetical protein